MKINLSKEEIDELDAMLGRVSDRVISELFNIPYNAVKHRRQALGIEGLQVRERKRNREFVEKYGSQLTDIQIANRLGITKKSVCALRKSTGTETKYKRNVDWDSVFHMLGTHRDDEVAKLLGVTPSAVRYMRYKKGIKTIYKRGNPKWCEDMYKKRKESWGRRRTRANNGNIDSSNHL